jgi:hypothetical protein
MAVNERSTDTGKPDEFNGSCPVWRGAVGKGLRKRYLACGLPNKNLNEAVQRTRRAVQARLLPADAVFVRRHRHVLVSNEEDLDAAAWRSLTVLKAGVPELERVHTLPDRPADPGAEPASCPPP